MDRQVETDRPSGTRGNIREFTHNETCQFECLKARAEEQAAEASSRAGKNTSGCVRALTLDPEQSPNGAVIAAIRAVVIAKDETRRRPGCNIVGFRNVRGFTSIDGQRQRDKKKKCFHRGFFLRALLESHVCAGV